MLEQTCQLARDNLKKVQFKQKTYYDKRARSRKFDVGDKVLLLLPTESNKLLAHLSRRLIGELIVYKGIRRPSVRRPSVRLSTFSNDISSEAVRPILFIFHI